MISQEEALAAATENNLGIVQQYLEEGGDVDAHDSEGRTLLQLVMLQPEFDEDLARLLIISGADLSVTCNDFDDFYEELSILHLAYLNGSGEYSLLLELLERKDINFNARYNEGFQSDTLHFNYTLHPGTNPLRMYEDGYALENATLLHMVVAHGNHSLAQKLCESGKFDINAVANLVHNKHLIDNYDDDGFSEFMSSTSNLKEDIGTLGSAWRCRTLIAVSRTAHVTSLHLAAMGGDRKMAILLLSHNANPTLEDSDGQKPNELAHSTLEDSKKFKDKGFTAKRKPEDIESLCELLDSKAVIRPRKKRYKPRLLVGEGSFSYVTALLKKHAADKPDLATAITATEYADYESLRTCHPKFADTIKVLRDLGATIEFGIDATRLHENPIIGRTHYPRIHFNFPHDKSNFHARTLPKMLKSFFASAANLQVEGEQILMALPTPGSKTTFYHSFVYGIFEASARASYVLINKRQFNESRYPGYEHAITGRAASATVADTAHEFIFAKTNLTYQQICNHPEYKPGGSKFAYCENNYYLRELDTSDGSSNYSESEGESSPVRTFRK